ncbi:methyltransferase domain-containing protein [Patescibacteria group bacterium]|nr:methyltransferase domain-containing protein [Patescibacteria group bacterium]MBU0847417.1 methyltransferase domain-containing protein [Patescibacteria group bacterium]
MGNRTYKLPFKPGDKMTELGGGDNPLFHPNVDSRQLPAVDIVADLEEPLPLENDSYDGIFSQFLMEHLRLTKVRGFISEVYRILKPGGIAVIITANLLEQAKWLIKKKEWDDVIIQMIFGGNPDYPENYHRSSLSPQYALKLFKEAGFQSVYIFEHPETKTDMIIEAKK